MDQDHCDYLINHVYCDYILTEYDHKLYSFSIEENLCNLLWNDYIFTSPSPSGLQLYVVFNSQNSISSYIGWGTTLKVSKVGHP